MWVENDETIWQMEDFWKSEHYDVNIPLFREEIKGIIEDANRRCMTPETLEQYIKNPKKFLEFIEWEEDVEV